MATKTITEVFNEVAEAIQEKKKDYTPIKPANFGKEIEDLKSGGDLVKTSTLTNPNIIIHLDKLKENLPKECLQRQLHYVYQSSNYLELDFSLTGADSYSMCYLDLYLFNLSNFYHQGSQDVYQTGSSVYLSLNNGIQQRIGAPDITDIYIYGPNGSAYISDVEVFDGITVSELIDNIITANGSAIIDLGEVSSYGTVIYSYAEKTNIYWYGSSSTSTPSCHDFYENATLTDLEDVVEFYTNQEI